MTIAEIFTASVRRKPNAIAIVDGRVRLTYKEWANQIAHLAGGLQELGLKPDDHFLAVLSNRFETASLYWACQFLGVIFTPYSWRASPADVEYAAKDSDAKAIAFETKSAHLIFPLAKKKQFSNNIQLIDVDDNLVGIKLANLLAAQKFMGNLPKNNLATSLMLYTSGTTGRPKGVPRSYNAEINATLGCIAQLQYEHQESTLGVMPLFHTMGIRSLMMSAFLNGKFVCMHSYQSETALSLITTENISALFLVPTMFHDLFETLASREIDLSSVRNIAYAGMSMPAGLIHKCSQKFPAAKFSNFYGSSEIYTFAVRNKLWENPGSAGFAGIGQTLRIVRAAPDESVSPNDLVSLGETGEIIASMSALDAFQEYWNRPDANKKSIRDGWYYTGDLGYFDQNDELYVVGRVDDMIISGGENVHAEEVENILAKSGAVVEAAVIGIPDERWGERIVAFIEPRTPNASPELLDEHCIKSGLARFKRPRSYMFIRKIPRSASGKLLRRRLREGEYELLPKYDNSLQGSK